MLLGAQEGADRSGCTDKVYLLSQLRQTGQCAKVGVAGVSAGTDIFDRFAKLESGEGNEDERASKQRAGGSAAAREGGKEGGPEEQEEEQLQEDEEDEAFQEDDDYLMVSSSPKNTSLIFNSVF